MQNVSRWVVLDEGAGKASTSCSDLVGQKRCPSHLYLPPMSRVTFCYLTSWWSGDEQHASGVLESVSSGRYVLVMRQETGSICLHHNKFNQSFTLFGI